MQLLSYPVLVVEVVDSVEEGRLLLRIGTAQVKCLRFVVAYRICLAVVERVIIAG